MLHRKKGKRKGYVYIKSRMVKQNDYAYVKSKRFKQKGLYTC